MRCHTLVHTTGVAKPHKCEICPKSFLWKADLKRHYLKHENGDKPFTCPICDKGFTRNNHMQTHLKIHEGLKPYSKKPRPFNDDLQKYMVIQEGDRPFKCSACGKSYDRKTHLARHVRTHSGKDNFVCVECNKSFTRKAGLQLHMKIHATKPFSCSQCQKSFGSEEELKSHAVFHTDRCFSCPICNRKYKRENSLRSHIEAHSTKKINPIVLELGNLSADVWKFAEGIPPDDNVYNENKFQNCEENSASTSEKFSIPSKISNEISLGHGEENDNLGDSESSLYPKKLIEGENSCDDSLANENTQNDIRIKEEQLSDNEGFDDDIASQENYKIEENTESSDTEDHSTDIDLD